MTTSSYFIADNNYGSFTPSDSSSSYIVLNGTTFRITTERTIISSSSTGQQGEMCIGHTSLLGIDTYYLYLCIATNQWVRSAFIGF